MLHLPVSKLQKLKKYIIRNNLIYPKLELVSEVDLVKSAFESCDDDRNMDLTQDELHQDHCLETLEKFFGLTKKGLDEIFPKIDANTDLKISLEEAKAAFESMKDLNRSDNKPDYGVPDTPISPHTTEPPPQWTMTDSFELFVTEPAKYLELVEEAFSDGKSKADALYDFVSEINSWKRGLRKMCTFIYQLDDEGNVIDLTQYCSVYYWGCFYTTKAEYFESDIDYKRFFRLEKGDVVIYCVQGQGERH